MGKSQSSINLEKVTKVDNCRKGKSCWRTWEWTRWENKIDIIIKR